MKNSDIRDPLFLEAVEAIDSGNMQALEKLLAGNPRLVKEKLDYPVEGYFKNPYLLWFVADNPIRVAKSPPNIVDITRTIIKAVKREAPGTAKEQLHYALGLVITAKTMRESGMQIQMIDLLIEEGAEPGQCLGALAERNIGAAAHMVRKGSKLTLPVAVGLGRMQDVAQLMPNAGEDDRVIAVTLAAFYGMPHMISYLLAMGANPNGYPKAGCGFHSHATPLHQAVCSGSLMTVKKLVEAGASLDATDKGHNGTPLDWAAYFKAEYKSDELIRKKMEMIEQYLREKSGQKNNSSS